MVDDRKDLERDDNEALSDALDIGGDSAPSLEDLLKDHGIDLGSEQDLDAMQDFSLTDNKQNNDDLFSPHDFDSDDHLFSEDLFAEPAVNEPKAVSRATTMDKQRREDNSALFEAPEDVVVSDFDDNTSMFDEETTQDGGLSDDDALFDYDPHTEASFADLGGAEPEFGAGNEGGGDGDLPPPTEKAGNIKQIFMRLGMLFVLASVIYGGIRLVAGGKTSTEAANEITTSPVAKIAQIPQESTTAPTPPPAASAAPTQSKPAEPPIATAAPPVATTPSPVASSTPLPVPGAVTSGLPATTPVVTAQPESGVNIPTPQISMPVTVPLSAVSPTASAAPPRVLPPVTQSLATSPTIPPAMPSTSGSTDIQQKLDNLETALRSIDQRLSQVGTGGLGDEKMQRLERLVNDSSAPEMQQVLTEAVRKMKELDRKLERISELQQQVRKLDSEVKTLKEDVVTQTNMVGEQQRLFNDNVQLSQLQEPGPVKMIVQAAIPGRAWLRSERGELLTVIPGDEVPGYGRVVSIDAASGTVVTSSRAVFREQ